MGWSGQPWQLGMVDGPIFCQRAVNGQSTGSQRAVSAEPTIVNGQSTSGQRAVSGESTGGQGPSTSGQRAVGRRFAGKQAGRPWGSMCKGLKLGRPDPTLVQSASAVSDRKITHTHTLIPKEESPDNSLGHFSVTVVTCSPVCHTSRDVSIHPPAAR